MVNNGFKFIFPVLLFLIASCGVNDIDGNQDNDNQVEMFLGTWNVSDQPARLNYIVTIQRSPLYADRVLMENFGDLGSNTFGLVVNNTIVIDQQDIGNGFTTEGSGNYISENKLEFEFFLDDGIDKELRRAIFTK